MDSTDTAVFASELGSERREHDNEQKGGHDSEATETHPSGSPTVGRRKSSSFFRMWAMTKRLSDGAPKQSIQREDWSVARQYVAQVVEIEHFDTIMAGVIAVNLGVMIHETNLNADEACWNKRCGGPTLQAINSGLLAIYAGELVARLFVYRWRFFCDIWMLVDFLVVCQGVVDLVLVELGTAMPNGFELLKLFRIFRVLRAVGIIRRVPELHTMIRGFFSAMAAMAWGFAMIVLLLVMWSILAVEFIHEKNLSIDHGDNQWCYQAFSSVQASSLFFFQTLVAGDSWGACAIPIIMNDHTTAIIFASALVCVQLGLTNLILSVIVDTATQERERDRQEQAEARRQREQSDTQAFWQVLKRIDKDGSGQICMEEMVAGYEAEPRVREMLKHFNMEKKDLLALFALMDADDSGEVSYNEFIEYLMEAQQHDARIQLMVLKLQMKNMARRFHNQVDHIYQFCLDALDGPTLYEGDASPKAGAHEAAGSRRPSMRSSRRMSRGPRSAIEIRNWQQQTLSQGTDRFAPEIVNTSTCKSSTAPDPGKTPTCMTVTVPLEFQRFQQYWDQRTCSILEDSQRRAEKLEARMDQHVQGIRDLLMDAPQKPFARGLPKCLLDGAAGSSPFSMTSAPFLPEHGHCTDTTLDPGWIPPVDRSVLRLPEIPKLPIDTSLSPGDTGPPIRERL